MNTRAVVTLAGLVPLPTAMLLAEELCTEEDTYDEHEEIVRRERLAEQVDIFPDCYPGICWP